MAAVTNLSHKPGSLTEQRFILSQFWRPNFQNQEFKVNKGGVASKTSGSNTFLASLVFWWLPAFPDLWPCYSGLCLCNPSLSLLLRVHSLCCCLVAQSCPTLFNHVDCSPPGSSVHGILQAKVLEWIAVPFSRRSSQPTDQTRVSCLGRQVLYH